MKVICIDDKPRYKVAVGLTFQLKFGARYNVVGQRIDPAPYGLSYELSELPKIMYPAFHFVPLSEIDETEFERNYNKELVN